MNNTTIETLQNHRSIRKFKKKQLSNNQIEEIIRSAQQASTSSYVMAYSIIGITKPKIKEELSLVSGQSYVKENGHFLVFCADLHRVYSQASIQDQEKMIASLESTEQFIVATVDASLAAQNAVIAAESMGLGACYIGSLRNNINKVNDLLELPDYVIPLFGLALGYPDEEPELKPRLPMEIIYHENQYNTNQNGKVAEFDEKLKDYYQSRSTNKRYDTWTNQMIRKYSHPVRLDVGPFVKNKNMNRS
ncbi:oxygen-insensitive NADPH nitroreductase [Ornithinibacillus halophilus]|uniref:FMN reductase (NADPH) n=1 Tax=Ornithinibacillus halophilus TaxID=930117 RepID=A0A1M5I970_9BACI|nr:oxygen-insensitive NADPH nitroreductase [Ornithinibacillus halophilus]SHG24792.1 FMN reductase (NADPH) [Ornithinibacillus halophilus]